MKTLGNTRKLSTRCHPDWHGSRLAQILDMSTLSTFIADNALSAGELFNFVRQVSYACGLCTVGGWHPPTLRPCIKSLDEPQKANTGFLSSIYEVLYI